MASRIRDINREKLGYNIIEKEETLTAYKFKGHKESFTIFSFQVSVQRVFFLITSYTCRHMLHVYDSNICMQVIHIAI